MTSTNRGRRTRRPPSFRRSPGRHVQETTTHESDNKPWGDPLRPNSPHHLRIGFLNTGRLPPITPHPKQDYLHHFISTHNLDILGISEVGLNWSIVPTAYSWYERTHRAFRQQSTTLSWNRHDIRTASPQWGGVALITTGITTTRIKTKGSDPRNLGRWCWTSYTGKHSKTVTIYSIYRPVRNLTGPLSVYQQQQTHLSSININTDPLTTWASDLKTELQSRIQAGEILIVGGDINSCILSDPLSLMLQEIGLIETVISSHPNESTSFSTYMRSDQSRIIDGIWASPSITINHSGYSPFEGWDHRLVWIDLDRSTTFGSASPIVPFPVRRLKTTDTRAVKNYLRHLTQSVQDHRLLQRARALNDSISTFPNQQQQAELESIDALRTKAMLQAERRCRKLRMGKVPFSPMVIQHALAKSFWQLLLRKRHGRRVSSRLLQRKRHQAKIPPQSFSSLTIPQIQQHIHACHTAWKDAKLQANSHRTTFLDSQASHATENDHQKAKALKQLQHLETTRKHHRQIRFALRGPHPPGLSQVFGPANSQGFRAHHTHPDAIATCCTTANQAKYRQTEATPFMQNPLQAAVGYNGLSPQSTSILNGTFSTSQLDPYTAIHVRSLRRPAHLRDWPSAMLTITPSEHAQAWRKAREKTSSSPSGLHFGMWKVNATDPLLCELDTIMREIPFRTGYSLHRWRHGIDVELQKEHDNYNIERMRTIVLIEADHNMNNKLLGKRAMAYGEEHNALAPEQYGSRKNLSAAQASVNNRLMYDIMRQTRQGGIVCSNDAQSCYDRIVHSG